MQSLGVVTRRVTEIFQLPGVEPVWTLTNASLNIHHILSFFLSFFFFFFCMFPIVPSASSAMPTSPTPNSNAAPSQLLAEFRRQSHALSDWLFPRPSNPTAGPPAFLFPSSRRFFCSTRLIAQPRSAFAEPRALAPPANMRAP